MSRFESLGDNCEFGFVQRSCGCEDSALFRWARIKKVEHLVGALQCRFAGMFEYETMRPCDLGMIEDRRHPVQWHTARATRKIAAEDYVCDLPDDEQRRIFADERSKFEHLRDAFLERRGTGERILVFKMNQEPAAAEVETLFRAIRGLGPGSLLIARQAIAGKPSGSVDRLEDGLYEGRLDGFAPYRHSDRPHLESWVDLCRNTLSLHERSQRSGMRRPAGWRAVLRKLMPTNTSKPSSDASSTSAGPSRPPAFLAELHRAAAAGLTSAVVRRDTAALFDWLIRVASFQGVSNGIAAACLDQHGSLEKAARRVPSQLECCASKTVRESSRGVHDL